MSNFVKRWLNRRKPFLCKLCGFTVPIIGTRWDQAGLAIDHMEDAHPIYYELGAS